MAVLDPDPDDIFAALMEDVILEEPTDAIDYTQLDDVELMKAKASVKQELFDMGELHSKNPRGRAADLHSQYWAIDAAMRARWPHSEETDHDS